MQNKIWLIAAVLLGLVAPLQSRAETQVGDFRLSSTAYSTQTGFDTIPANVQTRGVTGAPFQITSTLSGTSQNNDGMVDTSTSSSDTQQDLQLRTFTSSTAVTDLSRSTSTTTAGAIAYTFSLSNLASYLTSSKSSLTDVNLKLNLSTTTSSSTYAGFDVYLSYADATHNIATLSTSQATNYSQLWAPAQGAAVGSTVTNGAGDDVMVLASAAGAGAANATITNYITTDVTSLYNGGARQFTIFLVSANYGLGKTTNITTDANSVASGVYVTVTPEPASAMTCAVAVGLTCLRRRRRSSAGRV